MLHVVAIGTKLDTAKMQNEGKDMHYKVSIQLSEQLYNNILWHDCVMFLFALNYNHLFSLIASVSLDIQNTITVTEGNQQVKMQCIFMHKFLYWKLCHTHNAINSKNWSVCIEVYVLLKFNCSQFIQMWKKTF